MLLSLGTNTFTTGPLDVTSFHSDSEIDYEKEKKKSRPNEIVNFLLYAKKRKEKKSSFSVATTDLRSATTSVWGLLREKKTGNLRDGTLDGGWIVCLASFSHFSVSVIIAESFRMEWERQRRRRRLAEERREELQQQLDGG